ncbi:MAG: ABC transporter permease [Vulcanimicrobiaceae bacterium]
MTAYLIRRIAGAIPLLLFISIVSYALMALAPGGPAAILGPKGQGLSPEAIKHLDAIYGLDKPWYVQYFYWLQQLVLHGSLGFSYVDQRPVVGKVLEKLPVTVELIGLALALTLVVALPVGVYAGARRDSLFDNVTSAVGFTLYGMPTFWLGIVLVDLFAVKLHWFPSSGIASLGHEGDPIDRLRHLVLPVCTIALVSFATWMRFQRSSVIETLNSPFIRTARGKGLSERTVLFRHTLRNALLPTLTLLGLSLPTLVGGAYFVEYVFSIPGVGYLTFSSIFSRDYPTLMAITMLTAVLIVAGNLLADITYALVDPRIRYD